MNNFYKHADALVACAGLVARQDRSMASITTRRGDEGMTDLMFGRRVPKTSGQVAAYGCLDELNGALGPARIHAQREQRGDLADEISAIQQNLVALMGELATAPEDLNRYTKAGHKLADGSTVAPLDQLISRLEGDQALNFTHWVMPGEAGSLAGAHLDHARTVCRRAERAVLSLHQTAEGTEGANPPVANPHLLKYLNRLSDALWLLARWAEVGHAA